MGRGAGNAETELLLAYLSSSKKKISGFELSNLLEIFYEMKKKFAGKFFCICLCCDERFFTKSNDGFNTK